MSFLKKFSQRSTIAITGGASGIGLALAKRLSKHGHEVIVADRNDAKLQLVKTQVPELKTILADISTDAGRIAFHKQVITDFPEVNVLINNAGILDSTTLLKDTTAETWEQHKNVININFEAPVHLSTLFLPQLIKKPHALITNVTSAVAFFPAPYLPLYSATKAAAHSFTVSLRQQLRDTNVEVIEIAPPSVQSGINENPGAYDADVYAQDTVERMCEGKEKELGYGDMECVIRADRDTVDAWTEKFLTFTRV